MSLTSVPPNTLSALPHGVRTMNCGIESLPIRGNSAMTTTFTPDKVVSPNGAFEGKFA